MLYLKPNFEIARNNKVLLCFRQDREKISSHQEVFDTLKNLGIEYDMTDMNIHRKVSKENRKNVTYKKFEEFANYKMVITDRLHGMIFATITNTPCIAFDNKSKKVSGVYEWIKYLDYIKIADTKNFDADLIKKIYSIENHDYNQKPLLEHFDKINKYFKNSK